MQPLKASDYGTLDKSNPVISAFEKDLKDFKSYTKRIRESLTFDHFSYSRGSLKLFEIWKKYEPRLPKPYYEEHLLDTADFLFETKFYRLALWQGYTRYLHRFSPVSLENIKDLDQFKQAFFSQGFYTAEAKLTLRALYGECLCAYYLERERCRQRDCIGMQKLLNILAFLRIMTQAILPHESLSWLLYNGSLYIYKICRFLMSVSHSAQALEYLLWACVCLETSIPLLTPSFLSWRATLYCSVCECYYAGQAAVQAEMFARRALVKIDELGKLEKLSGFPSSPETMRAFKEATIKVAVMVFKRSVYESRRKPKGYFRLKQKSNLRDGHNNPWPRTTTERILMELFDGNAAQFLAVLEALWDSSRRPLQTGFPDDPDIQEVAIELMSAGISLLSGNGGSFIRAGSDSLPLPLNALTPTYNLMEMAIAGKNQISVDAAVKFVKLLFRYEQWDVFCSLSNNLVTVLPSLEGRLFRKAELELTLLEAVEHLISSQKVSLGTKDVMADIQTDKDQSSVPISMTDELLNLVQTLHVCVCEAAQDIRPDEDLVLDILLYLWAKCKLVFQRAQARHNDPVGYMAKMAFPDKWVQTLFLLCEVAYKSQLSDIDPVAVAEMTLRLASVLEDSAESPSLTISTKYTTNGSSLSSTPVEKPTATPSTNSQVEHLEMVWTVLQKGLECVSRGRTVCLPCGVSAISDTVYLQMFSGGNLRSSRDAQIERTSSSLTRSLLMDIHLELLAFQHRISFKLLDLYPDDENVEGRKRPLMQSAQGQCTAVLSKRARTECAMQAKIKKNKISRVLFLVQKALLFYKKDATNRGTKQLLEEALALLEKAGVEEKRLLSDATSAEMGLGVEEGCRPPPPPVLVSRSNQTLTFTPAPYVQEEQVCWYRIYGKEVGGVNLKVRIGDCHLTGTGEMIPSRGERLFCISGLESNQKYIFAVAAYDAQGNLIGGSIGDTTRPVLASLPLPLLTAWAHLAQVAYQTGQYALAKKACSDIWSHFTLPSVADSADCQKPVDEKAPERLAQTKLCAETLQLSSPILQQLFLTSIFMQTDINIQERALYCDSVSEGSPLIWEQEDRLAECEKMLVAIDLSLHLNDSSAALQGVVSCYGLLAPLIFYQIPSDPVIQVLLKCLMVLQEIPGALKQKRSVVTTESLYHMVACITHYVAKGLQASKEECMASSVMEQGKQLLMELSESLPQNDSVQKPQKKTVAEQKDEPSEELKALTCIGLKLQEKTGTLIRKREADSFDHDLSGEEDPEILYNVIGSNSLMNAFKNVMKFKQTSGFMEFAALLLEKAMQEDQLELLIQWGQEIFRWIKSRDESLMLPKKPYEKLGKDQEKLIISIIQFCNEKKRHRKKKAVSSSEDYEKEFKAVEIMMKHLGSVRSHQQQRMMRQMHLDELPWRCRANLTLAQAHFGLLRKYLQPNPVTPLQHCYSKLSLRFFSLANLGTLVKWKNISQQTEPPELSPSILKPTIYKAKDTSQGAAINSESGSGESEVESEMYNPCIEQFSESESSETTESSTQSIMFKQLDMVYKASLHIRRAMVLAYRGRLWTSLQWVCEILWDQFSTIAFLVECSQSSENPSTITLDQLYTVFTPLLALASELLMDMMEKLEQWKVYDEEGEELETRPLNNGVLIDLKWMKSLVLHTLELLFYQNKWEALAHLALLYNFYSREHYTHVITPVLVYAQRRLLERISYFGGPSVPQPHFTYTEMVTGKKVTCRNYAVKQLLLCSSVESCLESTSNSTTSEPLELAERRRAMCIVSVPLDIDGTLHCFRESQAKRRHTLRTFEHSRTLLMLLLANSQHPIEVPFCKEPCHGSQDKVEFNIAVSTAPSIGPPDLSYEDYNSVDSVYSSPLSPSYTQNVLSSYNSSIKYLQANNYNSLQVQALHDLGNLHFYNGNPKAAHTHWSKALDCSMQTTNVLESWDGDSWSHNSTQQPLRHAGIWGCLQGALLSAKIAQYIFTSKISQRTNCCLLSAKLFKCLLRASQPHPDNDLEYSSYTLNMELIPGVKVFSDSDQTLIGNTVASLGFVCDWLYTTGHHLSALPLLVLYQYVASKVCRHPHLTAGCRILKVKMLTELHLFAEAVKELHHLSDGEEVPQPHSSFTKSVNISTRKQFSNYKPLTDPCNLEVLEELVNKRLSEDIMALYGTKLTCQLHLARLQLILAICSTIHYLPEPLSDILEEKMRSSSMSSSDHFPSSPNMMSVEPKGLQLQPQKDTLTPGQVKALLLKETFNQLNSELYALQHIHTDPEELKLAVEIRLLLSSLTLQQGKAALSADQAASALRLLQDSPLLQSDSIHQLPLRHPSSVLNQSSTRAEHEKLYEPEADTGPQLGDMPATVEALEQMGHSLWLRCTVAVVQSLSAHIPGTVIYAGMDSSVEADRLIKQGLADAEAWGDTDTQALLLLQRVTLNTHCGRTPEESTSMLQEAVCLLSGRSTLSLQSGLSLAKATLRLSELRGSDGQPLYLLNQKLLLQQLTSLGECFVKTAEGRLKLLSTPAWKNIYHPQLPLLARTTMRLGQCLALQAMVSSSEEDKQYMDLWLSAQEELHSAFIISQTMASRDPQLEADILYLKGIVGRSLMSLGILRHQPVVETFLESITLAQSNSHSLQLIHMCYMEMALIYLQQWRNTPNDLPETPAPLEPTESDKCSDCITVVQSHVLLFWVCLRAAAKTVEVLTNHGQLCGITTETEGPLPLKSLKALADFVSNDLLSPCGGMQEPTVVQPSSDPDIDDGLKVKKCSEINWGHLIRYYTHLLNLRHISRQPSTLKQFTCPNLMSCVARGGGVEEFMSPAADSNLTLRLTHLHTFFSDHLANYKEQCVIPDPPSVLILEPQTIQPAMSDLYPWATLNTHQLCIQWHRPTLASNGLSPKVIMLVFALNKAPSDTQPNIPAAADIEAGYRLISTDSLKALHAHLISVCVETEVDVSVSGSSTSLTTSVSCIQESEHDSETPDKASTITQQQILVKKTTHVCTEIRNLLKPDLKTNPITKVPFEPSVQILCDLERCFNPASGATLEDRALCDWLFSLLI
ncbi:cilia- and flagella-associated protein 54 isoform X2 [Tachysurus fulvidraco]|uniref:cilia- and flagella-associated protein 54 isoform X2 n=1 Tax=Tachysurus fulvidraco TaxID=1234273 RepID=UPI001FEEEA1D|nr:cilia- and flagella-associated protein 54 isoform X2 [Tachysurus fulvidraco]